VVGDGVAGSDCKYRQIFNPNQLILIAISIKFTTKPIAFVSWIEIERREENI
jgi:hypothetical protein